jgi:hypothetical protein
MPYRQAARTRPVPAAYPMSRVTDLLGRMPVRLCTEDGDLVGYGFGGQRAVILAAEIAAVLVRRCAHWTRHHRTAAVSGRVSGSSWHGVPTGNVISGAALTATFDLGDRPPDPRRPHLAFTGTDEESGEN